MTNDGDERAIKVLVVDDRPENLFATKKVLSALEVEVITAPSGNDALREILHHDFAVVLLDVQMPGMDGFEVADLIRDNDQTRHLPIIFVTAISKEERFVFRGYDSGGVDYLFKPVDPRILLAKTRVFVDLAQHQRALGDAHVRLQKEVEERRRVESELQLAQKLEAVGQLAAGIAHEINTPAQFVGDTLCFLRDAWSDVREAVGAYQRAVEALRAAGGHDAVIAEVESAEAKAELDYLDQNVPASFDRCFDGVSRISSIVGAMKEFAHPDQREKTAVDLNKALASTLTISRNEYKYVADVTTEFGEIPPVPGHLGELNQVFLNMIVNAAHAISEAVADGERGSIRVRTRRENGAVVVEFKDTGCGIPEEIRGRIYDPFFTTKEVGRGSGQGLAISRNVVVEKHGGSLSCDSRLGEGTTFAIRLPIGDAP